MEKDSATREGLSYFDGGTWRKNITRDERFFCAHLYRRILEDGQEGVRAFIKHINNSKRCTLTLPEEVYWELGYEVCFYRDILFVRGEQEQAKALNLSLKRTFDLCLFSETDIVVIEAKAFQGFDSHQMGYFEDDKAKISEILGGVSVHLIGLGCESYINSTKRSARTNECFKDGLLSWGDMVKHLKKPESPDDAVLVRANSLYHLEKPNKSR